MVKIKNWTQYLGQLNCFKPWLSFSKFSFLILAFVFEFLQNKITDKFYLHSGWIKNSNYFSIYVIISKKTTVREENYNS